jgi:hypothetical protein
MSKEAALAVATASSPSPEAAPTAATTGTSTPPEMGSKQFALFAKKEAQLVQDRQALNAERDRVQGAAKQYDEYLNTKKTDPIKAMKMMGFTETDIFNYMAAAEPQEVTPEQKAIQAAEAAADAKIKSFEQAQTKKEQEAQAKADQSIIQSYRQNVSRTITANPEKYEYCKYHGPLAEELIYETVLKIVTDSQGKDVPTAEEAAQMVEDFYEGQDKQMSQLKKRQPKPSAETTPQPTRTRTLSKPPVPTAPARTLSSRATVTSSSVKPLNETRDQKRERLINMLKA